MDLLTWSVNMVTVSDLDVCFQGSKNIKCVATKLARTTLYVFGHFTSSAVQ